MNRATSDWGLFKVLRDKFANVWRKFIQELSDNNEPVPTSSAKFQLPLKPYETATVRLAVMPLSLERTE